MCCMPSGEHSGGRCAFLFRNPCAYVLVQEPDRCKYARSSGGDYRDKMTYQSIWEYVRCCLLQAHIWTQKKQMYLVSPCPAQRTPVTATYVRFGRVLDSVLVSRRAICLGTKI